MDVLNDNLLTTAEAAAMLHIKQGTLEVWRVNKRYALPFVRVGRNIRYRRSDLLRFVEQRTEAA